MELKDRLKEQTSKKFKQGYLHYSSLLAQIQAATTASLIPQQKQAALHGLCCLGHDQALHINERSTENSAIAALLLDTERVHLFAKSQQDRLWAQLLDLIFQLRSLAEDKLNKYQTDTQIAFFKESLHALGEELVELDDFLRHNIAACATLAQLADGHPHATAQVDPAYIVAVESVMLGTLRLDAIILGLSDAFELLRMIESDAADLAAALSGAKRTQWVAPQEFQRITRKFWVLPQKVVRFKIEVLKHLPVLIYGDRQKTTEVDPGILPFLAPPPTQDSAAVSSVYLDALPELPLYHSRLRREDGATAVRVRWYGQRDPHDPQQQLFIERKIHREAYTNEFSTKERAPIAQRYMSAFLSGQSLPLSVLPPGSHEEKFLSDVQKSIAGQHPVLRTTYRRTAFQFSTDNVVRISLDTNLVMTKERHGTIDGGINSTLPGDWLEEKRLSNTNANIHIGKDHDTVHFPYAVVELKLQSEAPEWIEDLIESGLLLVIPKFSKYLHGLAVLYQEYTENVPHWFLPDEKNNKYLTPATWEEMSDASDQYADAVPDWVFPSGPTESTTQVTPPPATAPSLAIETATLATTTTTGSSTEQKSTLPPPEPNDISTATAEVVRRSTSSWQIYQNPATPPPVVPATPAAELQDINIHAPPRIDSHTELLHATVSTTPNSSSDRQATGQSTPQDSAEDMEAGHRRRAMLSHDPKILHAELSQRMLRNAAAAATTTIPDATSYAVVQYQSAQHAMMHDSTAHGYTKSLKPQQNSIPLPNTSGLNGSAQAFTVSQSGRAKALVRTRVEPKTFFANERTFLQWLNISVLVMFLALSLLSGSSLISSAASSSSSSSASGCSSGDHRCVAARISGALIAPVALSFMAYALFMYKKRTQQILRKETVRYDDQRGPVVLVAILIAVMVISYVLAVIYVF